MQTNGVKTLNALVLISIFAIDTFIMLLTGGSCLSKEWGTDGRFTSQLIMIKTVEEYVHLLNGRIKAWVKTAWFFKSLICAQSAQL